MPDSGRFLRRFRKGKIVRAFVISAMLGFSVLGVSANVVIGNGKIETERRSVPAFKSVALSGSGTLRVHKGESKVEVTCDSNILPYITTAVSNGELVIGFKPALILRNPSKIQFDVTLPDLRGMRIAGSGDAFVDSFSGDSFSAEISGSGNLKAELEYGTVSLGVSGSGGVDAVVKTRTFDLRCAGSGDAKISGSADSAGIEVAGSGSLQGADFAAIDARVRVSGSGRVDLRAKKSLNAALMGSGSLHYWGDPSITQSVMGSGSIKKAGD
jgi:hypothetical protein